MPVPEDIRKNAELVNSGNLMKYMVGTFEKPNGGTVKVFLHEAVWVLINGLIPDKKLVSHKDGNALNNSIDNLELVDENGEYGDLHTERIFHVSSCDMETIKAHFPDIYAKVV